LCLLLQMPAHAAKPMNCPFLVSSLHLLPSPTACLRSYSQSYVRECFRRMQEEGRCPSPMLLSLMVEWWGTQRWDVMNEVQKNCMGQGEKASVWAPRNDISVTIGLLVSQGACHNWFSAAFQRACRPSSLALLSAPAFKQNCIMSPANASRFTDKREAAAAQRSLRFFLFCLSSLLFFFFLDARCVPRVASAPIWRARRVAARCEIYYT